MKTVNRHLARIFAIVLSAIMLVSNTGAIEAKASSIKGFETKNINDSLLIIEPGKTTHFNIPVKVTSGFCISKLLYATESQTELIKLENIKLFSGDVEINPYELFSNDLDSALTPFDVNGNVRVLKVYWKSRRKIKKVKSYDPETGEEQFNFYPETYFCDPDKGEEEQV
ncbi:MAG: hypothetical protein II694_12170, partial [Lachnospiraceae bacterium]|nr:hypothetical protein [Lachnospiraceae bacterium]